MSARSNTHQSRDATARRPSANKDSPWLHDRAGASTASSRDDYEANGWPNEVAEYDHGVAPHGGMYS